jgi:hypothetical protein
MPEMIYREKILAALEGHRGEFERFESDLRHQYVVYGRALDDLLSVDGHQLIERLQQTPSPGAVPTDEFFNAASFVIPFENDWGNHEQSRAWAYETLIGRTTFAADGSQIIPTKDYSVPVAAVQVGWFENRHTTGGAYVKDARFEVLTPAEVMVRSGGDTDFSEQVVHRRRYGMEIDAIRNYMTATAAKQLDPASPPVVFFDSLLVISFAELLPEEMRGFYISEIISLLDTSRATGIPVVGYIDRSFARDVVNMLQSSLDLEDSPRIHDSGLFAPLMKWGDRTPLFRCERRGILAQYGEQWQHGIGFLYMKTAGDAPPSRLDVPMWVYERGLLDYVVDTVRAEVIVGNGYPYPIEAADATAVLTSRDREMFYSIFQEFALSERLDLHVARKAISKAHRRQ